MASPSAFSPWHLAWRWAISRFAEPSRVPFAMSAMAVPSPLPWRFSCPCAVFPRSFLFLSYLTIGAGLHQRCGRYEVAEKRIDAIHIISSIPRDIGPWPHSACPSAAQEGKSHSAVPVPCTNSYRWYVPFQHLRYQVCPTTKRGDYLGPSLAGIWMICDTSRLKGNLLCFAR